jgi:2-polyprenyl-6-methoxyphenol hydroxylase-like FAD-dependent oxidoreductase
MDFDADVAVVGAGPTGLMLAGDLARAGVHCVVLERHDQRSGLARAFAVHARTLEQLDARGVADELIASGATVAELRFLASGRLDLSALPSRFPYLLVTPQYETERVLGERAAQLGVELRHGAEVTGLTQDADGVELKVRGEAGQDAVVRAKFVVGADGMHSAVREAIGMPFPGKPVVQSVMLAEVQLSEPPPEVLTTNTTGDAFAIVAPFGDGWYRVIAWHRANQPPEDAPVSLDEIADVTRQALGTDYGMRDPRWMSRFHSEERQVPCYRDGRVLLAGDAAHVHSPAGGLGMNTSIQDAANLGWKLAATVQGWAPDGLLDTYHAERHPVGREVLRGSGALLRIGLTGPRAFVAARNVLAAGATRIPAAARHMAGALSGISISYPAPPGAHPLAGKRVADLPLAGGRRLYETLRSGRFVLAAGGKVPLAEIGPVGSYGGRVESVAVKAPTSTVALIRPDAYIAWAAGGVSGSNMPKIRTVLEYWCASKEAASAEQAA